MNLLAILWLTIGIVFVLWIAFIFVISLGGAFAYLFKKNKDKRYTR